MSTISYSPNQAYLPSAELSLNHCATLAGSEAGVLPASQLLGRLSRNGRNCTRGTSEVSEDELITAAQHGDHPAFVELCRRHSSLTKKKIFSIVRNHEDAEDVFQDTLLRAYIHIPSFRRSCKFSTWLTTIGMNSALMLLRRRRARPEIDLSVASPATEGLELPEPVDRSPGPEGIYLRKQTILLVRREVEKLKPILRSVVSQYYGSDCSLEEAAREQDISVGAAKSRLLRGRVRLRSSLSRYGISKAGN